MTNHFAADVVPAGITCAWLGLVRNTNDVSDATLSGVAVRSVPVADVSRISLIVFVPPKPAHFSFMPVTVKSRPPSVGSHVFWTLRSEEHTSELQSPCNLVCR